MRSDLMLTVPSDKGVQVPNPVPASVLRQGRVTYHFGWELAFWAWITVRVPSTISRKDLYHCIGHGCCLPSAMTKCIQVVCSFRPLITL